MKTFRYQSGEEIKAGDRILYGGKPGEVEFVVTAATGEPSRNWFLEEHPEGGIMLMTGTFGSVAISGDQIADDEDLELVARGDAS